MDPDHPEQSTPFLHSNEKELGPGWSWMQDSPVTDAAKIRKVRQHVLSFMLVRPTHVSRLGKRLGYALVPQPLRTIIWKDSAPPSKTFSTAYLNGLRGCTALKVFTFHYISAFSDSTFQPWGTNQKHRHVLELPIIRYFYSGFTSHIFFGVAGYLTSIRLLQLMDSPDSISHAKVLALVSSSLFRRAFRLYIPVLIITLMTATWIYFGFYEYYRPFLLNHTQLFPGFWNEEKPAQFPTYGGQLGFWASEMYALTDICTERTVYPIHDQHLWSILSEMRASLHLYGCLLALAQCRKRVRLVMLFGLALLYFYWNHWEIWVYILGAAIAQIDIMLTESEKEHKMPTITITEAPPTSTKRRLPNAILRITHLSLPSFRVIAFFIAFYFLSYPIDSPRDFAPGYMTLNYLIPDWMERKDKFYPNIGTAILLLLLVRADPQTSRWRRLLTSRIPQYMGSISFGFYLVHGPIMHFWGGFMIPQWVWQSWLGLEGGNETTDMQWIVGILAGWIPTLIMSLWVSDVWTREVEGRCVRAVKWLEGVSFRTKVQ